MLLSVNDVPIGLRGKERVCHGAADDEVIHFAQEISEQLELGGNLRAANDCCDRPLRTFQHTRQRFDLGLHRPTREGG
jgi:hypothetical protein